MWQGPRIAFVTETGTPDTGTHITIIALSTIVFFSVISFIAFGFVRLFGLCPPPCRPWYAGFLLSFVLLRPCSSNMLHFLSMHTFLLYSSCCFVRAQQ